MATYKDVIIHKLPFILSCHLLKNLTLDDIIIQAYLAEEYESIPVDLPGVDYDDHECNEFKMSITAGPYHKDVPFVTFSFKNVKFDNMINVYIFCRELYYQQDIVSAAYISYTYDEIKEYFHNLFLYMMEYKLDYIIFQHIVEIFSPRYDGNKINIDDKTQIIEQYGSLLHTSNPDISKKVTNTMNFNDVIIYLCSYLVHGVDLKYEIFYQRYIISGKYIKISHVHNKNAMLLYGIIHDITDSSKIYEHRKCSQNYYGIQSINYVFSQGYIQDVIEKIQKMQINNYIAYRIYKVLLMYSGSTNDDTKNFYKRYINPKDTKSARKC